MKPVFISYVRENKEVVDKLYQELKLRGIKAWLDRRDLGPGVRWRRQIRKAIRQGAFFIACFSKEYHEREKTYMNEELTVAIEELRQLHIDRVWFIPVRLDAGEVPDIDIGRGETLRDLQDVKLYEGWNAGIQSILNVIQPERSEPTIGFDIVKKRYTQNEQHIEPEVQDYLERGVEAHEEGDLDGAIVYYTAAIQLDSELVPLYYNRSVAYLRKGEIDKAIKDFSEIIEKLKPNYIGEYLNSDVGIKKNEDDRCIFTKAYYKRGVAYFNKGDLDAALKDYDEAIRLDPNYVEAYVNRGATFSREHEYDRAFADYKQAIILKPHYVNIYFNRGTTYNSKGEIDRAIEDYTTAIEIRPEFTIAYYSRAEAWLRLKEWGKAKKDLITAKNKGLDIIAVFHHTYGSITVFEQKHSVKLPEDIAALLMQQ